MSQRDDKQFLALYTTYRYEDQLKFYKVRHEEFEVANTQAVTISIVLIFLTALTAGVASSTNVTWLKLTCLLIAAISPILSSALAGYSALYGFEQQAKLYQDTINNLRKARVREPQLDLSEASAQQVNEYIQEIENVLLVEQGQWGQLARELKPSEA
jgi:SMODS and SLOG-associating 2TM effector domain 1